MGDAVPYAPGDLSRLLSTTKITALSKEDSAALKAALPEFISKESIQSVNLLKAEAQIKSLREVEAELRTALTEGRSEAYWQSYIHERILIIQQGYIRALPKLNVTVGGTKFPDFMLVTHDGYLDILEIKKADAGLLKHDSGRGNYYWDPEISKAIIQTENYIDAVSRAANDIRSYLKDTYRIDLQVVRPRGIILAGDARALVEQKQRDDFRLLCHGLKNVSIVTYDELLTRLANYITVLEALIPKKTTQ